MTGLFRRFSLYLNTVRWLRLSQLGWIIYRRCRPTINPAPVGIEPSRGKTARQAFISGPQPDQYELRFLNVSRPADPANIDWHPADVSKLWRYNLHYFDYLQWSSMPDGHKPLYIESWIAANPTGAEDAWEPYTVSLRIVNWIKYFHQYTGAIPVEWQLSLINQAHWLSKNLERHILANHFLKNAKALVFAGMWFKGRRGKSFLQLGTNEFLTQIAEQFLADGGHFERSPMYHSISLEDCLDVYNLVGENTELVGRTAMQEVREVILRGLRFLDDMLEADDCIPLFNDSAHAIAPEPIQLIEYGCTLTGYERAPRPAKPLRICKRDSGYYGYRYGDDTLLIDGGPVGPDFQPGHAHCDTLSYTWCVDGQRLIVDSGVYGYGDDGTRNDLRGTAAHNTVMVDGVEQSEVWGTFRVARRARPHGVTLSDFSDSRIQFVGSHDGYKRLPGRITHAREMNICVDEGFAVHDVLSGGGACEAESFIHFHPAVKLVEQAQNTWQIVCADKPVATLTVAAHCDTKVAKSDYCPRFGVRQEGTVVTLATRGELPLKLEYQLARTKA